MDPAWQEFLAYHSDRGKHLLHEVSQAIRALVAIVETHPPDPGPRSPGLAGLEAFYAASLPALLAPIQSTLQAAPLRRALSALTSHEDEVRARLRRELPSIVEHAFLLQLERRARFDGQLLLEMARVELALREPWRCARLTALGSSAPFPAAASLTRMNNAAERWRRRIPLETERLGSLALRERDVPARVLDKLNSHRRDNVAFWARQIRAVGSVLALDLKQVEAEHRLVAVSLDSLAHIEAERESLVAEVAAAIGHLKAAQTAGGDPGEIAPLRSSFHSSSEQAHGWVVASTREINASLPESVETSTARSALPGRYSPWRVLQPAAIFRDAVSRYAASDVDRAFSGAQSNHIAITRALDRAREVIAFGRSLSGKEAAECTANAIALLEYQRDSSATPASVARTLEDAVAQMLEGAGLALERRRIGFLAHLAEHQGTGLVRDTLKGLHDFSAAAYGGVSAAVDSSRCALRRSLGFDATPETPPEAVTYRPRMEDLFEVQWSSTDLPALYRRLFDPQPLDNARFLVGRESELAGLAEAFRLWQAGKPAAVLIVGERGSGKTSLIRCAAPSSLQNVKPLISASFRERVVTADGLREFLAAKAGLSQPSDLLTRLQDQPNLVLLEELERTYLRGMGGFDAIRALMDMIHETGEKTLWIASINEAAFHFLDATIGLGRAFPFIINTRAVTAETIESAILQRHHLSGLRLHFAAPPVPHGLAGWLRDRRAPQQTFFDGLHHRSHGVFRAAFELWQASVERVEGGVVFLRQPANPDLAPLDPQLDLYDGFVLSAVRQHGSLTAREAARIFDGPWDDLDRRMSRLEGLGLLVPDPGAPGLRIVPEALAAVRELLLRRNLL